MTAIAPNQESRASRIADLFAPAFIDVFAGMGGWGIGQEQAFVRAGYKNKYIDLMINHWNVAIGVHLANHPLTEHVHANVLEVDPKSVLLGRRIIHAHFSPDCTDHSKAKGGKPRRKEIRALADVVIVWAAEREPDIITLENVEEFQQWGPLLPNGQPDPSKRCQEFNRWIGELRALGYVVEGKELRACDYGAPTTRKRFFLIARRDGNPIVWPARSHAAPKDIAEAKRKIRLKRLGLSDVDRDKLKHLAKCSPYRTAAECIKWDEPMLSIFASKAEARAWSKSMNVGRDKHERIGVPQRPLRINTQKRLAGGLWKWALNQNQPFIVNIENYGWGSSTVGRPVSDPLSTITAGPKGGKHAVADVGLASFTSTLNHGGGDHRSSDLRQPLNTVTAANEARAVVGAEVSPLIVGCGGASYAGKPVPADRPLGTVMTNDRRAVAAVEVVPFTAGVGGRAGQSAPTSADAPLPTITGKADRVIVGAQIAPFTVPRYGERPGQSPRSGSVDRPLPTITSTDNGAQIAAIHLSQYHTEKGSETRGQGVNVPLKTLDTQNRFGCVAAHLMKFRGKSPGTSLDDPMDTVTAGGGQGRPAGAGHAMGLAACHLTHLYSSSPNGGQGDVRKPIKTITSANHAGLCAIYLTPYYSSDSALDGHSAAEPMPTVTSKARFGMAAVEATRHWLLTPAGLRRARRVANWARKMLGKKVERFMLQVRDEAGEIFQLLTLTVGGALHLITDILMRMLKPRELARAQGFDDSYIIDRMADGTRISKADQVKLIGNSVPPVFPRAIIKANIVDQGLLDDPPLSPARSRSRRAVAA